MTTLQEVRERFADVEDPDERERLMCEALMAPPERPVADPHTQVPATQNGRRRRNYGAMLQENLMRAIRQLEQGFGDAYDQCIERGHMPNDDLWLARYIARQKGWLPPEHERRR